MRQCPDQLAGAFDRELRIGIERNHIPHRRQHREIAVLYGEAGVSGPAQQVIEFRQLAALALPPHPSMLARVPAAFPMEQEESIGTVTFVQPVDARLRCVEDGFVGRRGLGVRVREVGEERKVNAGVPVREEADLHLVEQ